MTSVAKKLGVERATISKLATDICRQMGMSPSFHMKSEAAQDAYRTARLRQLSNQESNGN
jgi:hypothetical protein